MIKHRRSAFGLAETLLASLMIAFTLVGLYGITTSITRANEANMKRVTAASLAEEAIELIRYQHDRYWIGGLDKAGDPFTPHTDSTKVDFFNYLYQSAEFICPVGMTANNDQIVWQEDPTTPSCISKLMQADDISTTLAQLADPLTTKTYQRTLTVMMYKDAGQTGMPTPWDELRHVDNATGASANFQQSELSPTTPTLGDADIKKDLLKVTAEVKWKDAAGHEQSYVSSTFVTNWLEGVL